MQTLYEQLAALFRYPGDDYGALAESCRLAAESECPPASALLAEFCTAVRGLSTDELQEHFTRAFDLNPSCTLEIGWHLFGEDYKRGEFLVTMRQQLRGKGVEESLELPDHLTHGLLLLSRLQPEEALSFVRLYLQPALDKMAAAWRKQPTPFSPLLEATLTLITDHYPRRQTGPAAAPVALRVLS